MPIDIRPSDVMGQVAETFRRTTQSLLGIRRDVYEAERVSQVNQGLAFFEQSFFEYEKELPKQQFKVPLDDVEKGGATVLKSLGEANWGAVEQNYADYVDKQLEYVNKTVTNKQARRELIQHLDIGSVAHKRRVQNSWEEAADHAERASLNQLIEVVMQSNVPWERKVSEISSRVDEMVKAGRLWKDEGEKVKREITAAAQYSHASNGAMEAMKNGFVYEDSDGKEHIVEPGIEAGEAWMNVNTPFYDGNPDARAQILREIRGEYDYDRRMEDEQLDRDFSDMHIGADTLEKVDKAMTALKQVQFYDGDMKYTWEQRFTAKAEYIERGMALSEDGAKALKAEQDKYYDHLLARITRKKREGASDEEIYKELAYPSYWHYTKDGVLAPLISGDQYSKLSKDLEAEDNAAFDAAMEYLYTKGAGLTDEEQMIADKDFRTWWRTSTDTSPEKAIQAAQNIVDPAVAKRLEQLVDGAINYNLRGPKRLSKLEKMVQAVEAGGLVGLAQVIGEDLALYGAAMVELARREHPEEGISVAFPDTGGRYGAPEGTPILTNAAKQVYIFKMEDKEAVLYRLGRDKAGAYEWQRLDTSAEVKTQIKEEAQIIRGEEQEQERADDLQAVADLFEGKTAGLDLADWERVGKGWKNTKTGKMADARTIMTLNRLEIFKGMK